MMKFRTRSCFLAAGLLWTGGSVALADDLVTAPPMLQIIAAQEKAETHGADGHAAEGSHGAQGGHDAHSDHDAHGEGHHHAEPSDLGLSNLGEGWSEPFEEREREGRAPRFNLFKSRQGFLERILLVDYTYTSGLEKRSFDEHETAVGLEWAFSRRFQLGLETFYTWQRPLAVDGRRGDGLRWDASTRLQLIDTNDRAYNFQIHVITPQSHVDAAQTELAFTLAGFEDLTDTLGLARTGLYHHIEYANLVGPRGDGPDRKPANLMRYDVSIAKTLTDSKTPMIADFTVFLETFGATNLDGPRSGHTDISFTPGIRFNPTGRVEKAWWVQTGIEFPVTGARPFNERIFVAVIHDF